MSQQEFQNQLKLSQIAIVNFLNFKDVELHLETFTSVNGKGSMAKALPDLVEAMKFVFDCSETALEKLVTNTNVTDLMEVDQIPTTYVEIKVCSSEDEVKIFRKTILNNDARYEIDGVLVTNADYKEELSISGIISWPLNTLIIDASGINKITTLTASKRALFIENLCGSFDTVNSYNQLKYQMEDVKLVLDSYTKIQKELAVNKKKVKSDKESSALHSELVKRLEAEKEQHDLFQLFHNTKFLESTDQRVEELNTKIEKAKVEKVSNAEKFEATLELEKVISLQQKALKKKLEDNSEKLRDFVQVSQQGLVYDAKQKSLETKLISTIESNENKIAKAQSKITQLKQHLSNDPQDKEYLKLKRDFLKKNRDDLMNFSNENEDIEHYKECIDIFAKRTKEVEVKYKSASEKIQNLQLKLDNKQQKKAEARKEENEIFLKKTKLKNLEDAKSEKSKEISASSRQKVLNELKKQFPDHVKGRLSELTEVVETADDNEKMLVKARLRKFSNAIVVDNRETAEKCVNHLRIKQLEKVDETFLILSELTGVKTSKDLLPYGEIPGWPCDVIEKFMRAKNEDAEKALMICLQPSVVFEPLRHAEQVLDQKETLKLNVMSSAAMTCFTNTGFIEKYASRSTAEDDIDGIEAEILEIQQNLEMLRVKKSLLPTEDDDLPYTIESIKNEIQIQRTTLDSLEKELKYNQNKVDKYSKKLQTYEQNQKRKLDEEERNHYQEFCQRHNIESIQEYLETTPEVKQIRIASLEQEINECRKDNAHYTSLTEKVASVRSEPIQSNTEELNRKQAHKDQLIKEYTQKVREHSEVLQELKTFEATDDDTTQFIIEAYEEIYDTFHVEQTCYQQNFEILSSTYTDQRSIPLSNGKMEDFMIVPDEIPDGFNLFQEQLKTVDVNFNKLNDQLKTIEDVKSKNKELSETIEKLRQDIESTAGMINEEVNNIRLKRLTDELKAVNRTLNDQKEHFEVVEAKFKDMKNERKKRFEESLEALNEGLDEFCELAFSQRVVAYLEVSNTDEPYNGEVSFIWQSVNSTEDRVTEISQNYTSSLALIFAILRLKKQKFVILNDATKNIINDLGAFFKQQTNIQVVLLTSRIDDEKSDYSVRFKSQSLVVTRMAR